MLHDAGDSVSDVTLDITEALGNDASMFRRIWRLESPKLSPCRSLRSFTLCMKFVEADPDAINDTSNDSSASQWSQAVSLLTHFSRPLQLGTLHLVLTGNPSKLMRQFRAAEQQKKLADVLKEIHTLESVLLTLMSYSVYQSEGIPVESTLGSTRRSTVEEAFREALQELAKKGYLRARHGLHGTIFVLNDDDD